MCRLEEMEDTERRRLWSFLQGREYPGELLCIPCDAICKAMDLEPGTITRVKIGCYGLVHALWSDPCMWAWRPGGVLKGLISCHVDDFLFCGPENEPSWHELLERLASW